MKIYLTFLLVCISLGLISQNLVTMTPVEAESKVDFKIRNLGIKVGGSFTGLQGSVVFNPGDLMKTVINMSVDATTINTGIGARDKHLRKEDYFGVDQFKKISFISSSVVNGSKTGTYIVYGNLTIKKTTKRVGIPFTTAKKANGFLFEGSFELNRRDFEVGGNSFSLSDDVTINLSVLIK